MRLSRLQTVLLRERDLDARESRMREAELSFGGPNAIEPKQRDRELKQAAAEPESSGRR